MALYFKKQAHMTIWVESWVEEKKKKKMNIWLWQYGYMKSFLIFFHSRATIYARPAMG